MSGGTPLNRSGATTTATIASSGTTSDAIEYQSSVAGGFILPATFTGTTITFTTCSTGSGTFQALTKSDGTAVSYTVAAGKNYPLPSELAGFPWFKLVSGSSEGGARSIVIVRKR